MANEIEWKKSIGDPQQGQKKSYSFLRCLLINSLCSLNQKEESAGLRTLINLWSNWVRRSDPVQWPFFLIDMCAQLTRAEFRALRARFQVSPSPRGELELL